MKVTDIEGNIIFTTGLITIGEIMEYVKKKQIDLRKADFSHFIFSGIDLSRMDLSGGYFYKATLIDTNLCGANLIDADFSRANLTGVDLRHTNLSGACFNGADLFGAKTNGANLNDACLCNAKLYT